MIIFLVSNMDNPLVLEILQDIQTDKIKLKRKYSKNLN